MLAEGAPRDIVRDPIVRKAYLGSSFRGDEFDDVPHTVLTHDT